MRQTQNLCLMLFPLYGIHRWLTESACGQDVEHMFLFHKVDCGTPLPWAAAVCAVPYLVTPAVMDMMLCAVGNWLPETGLCMLRVTRKGARLIPTRLPTRWRRRL